MKNRQPILFGIGVGIGIAIVLLLVFFAGIHVGSNRAGIFPFWERRYHTAGDFISGKFGHGTIGTIDSIGNNTLVVKDRSEALKTVFIDDKTILRHDGSPIKFSDLKKDEKVIIVGEPQEQEGAIKARVIRIITEFEKRATKSSVPYLK